MLPDNPAFTPGPWHIDRGQIRDKNGDSIGSYPYTLGDDTDHANGRLMAAAPELLEALKRLAGLAGPVLAPALQEAQELITRIEKP